MGTKWIGESGWVHVTRGKLTASNEAWAKPGFVAGEWKTYKTPGHQRNFVDCVLSRGDTIANAEPHTDPSPPDTFPISRTPSAAP